MYLEKSHGYHKFAVCFRHANLAQLVEQLIRNEQAVGSNPMVGSLNFKARNNHYYGLFFVHFL